MRAPVALMRRGKDDWTSVELSMRVLPAHRDARELDADGKYAVVPKWALGAAGFVSPEAREIRELLLRYSYDNVFDPTKFRTRFPDFEVTTLREGFAIICRETSKG